MSYCNYLRKDDFKKLTTSDIKKIEKEVESLKEFKGDKKEWIADNIDLIKDNEIVTKTISDKIVAGQITMKLFRIKLIRKLEDIKKDLESSRFNYNNINIDNDDKGISVYSTLYIKENTYLIRVRYNLGTKTYLGSEFNAVKFVDVIYHTDKDIIEVRSDHRTSTKIIKFLETQLSFSAEGINILEKHKNIEKFAKSINGTFKKISSNTSMDISELNEEDSIALGNMVIALDEYLIDKDEQTFLEKIKSITFENDKLTFSYAFLAGCKQIGITVSSDSDVDVLNQGLYKVLNKHLSSDNGYILLKKDNEDYTIKVSTKSNTIRFMSSAKEEIIELVINNIINSNTETLTRDEVDLLSKEIETFINSEIVNSFRPESLVEKFKLSEDVVSKILNKYIEDDLIYETLEIVSPDTGIVIKEFDSIQEINDFKQVISDVYGIISIDDDEDIVETFIDSCNEYIYYKYSINKEKINQINESKNENIDNIFNILIDKLNDNESIFTSKEDTFLGKLKGRILFKKKKAS